MPLNSLVCFSSKGGFVDFLALAFVYCFLGYYPYGSCTLLPTYCGLDILLFP